MPLGASEWQTPGPNGKALRRNTTMLGGTTGSPQRKFAVWFRVRTWIFTLNVPASADSLTQQSLRRSLMRTANFDDLSTRLLKKNTSNRKRDPRRPIFQNFLSSFVSYSRSILDQCQVPKKYWSIYVMIQMSWDEKFPFLELNPVLLTFSILISGFLYAHTIPSDVYFKFQYGKIPG